MKWLIILVFFLLSVRAYAQKEWSWVETDFQGIWITETGDADVEIQGESFHAKLYSKKNPKKILFTLVGTIKDGKLKATFHSFEERIRDSVYTGTYKQGRIIGDIDTSLAAFINLTDGENMIGLGRNLPED